MRTEPGEPIKMYCAACNRPWRFDTASSRSYICPCGGQVATGNVTFTQFPDGGSVVLDGTERDFEGGLLS